MTTNGDNLGEFVRGYVECALWSSMDESDESGGRPLDENYGPEDLSAGALNAIEDECRDFVEGSREDLEAYAAVRSWGDAGHDFWLTRNRHGAGFWDRGLGDLGDRLTAVSHPYGESYLMVNGENLIDVS